MTFDETVELLRGVVGTQIEASVWRDRVGEFSLELVGVLMGLREVPGPVHERDKVRYWCEFDSGSGFRLSPDSFKDAGFGVFDPEENALFISVDGDIVIAVRAEGLSERWSL